MSDGADLDIRWPIGLLFVVMGVLLLIYGAVSPQVTTYRPNLESARTINLDLIWGVVMLAFGAVMSAAAAVARRNP